MQLNASLLSAFALVAACSAQAAVTVTISQVGNDIVLTGHGTLNIDGLTRDAGTVGGSLIIVSEAIALSGVYGTLYYGYSSADMTAPDSFGINLGANTFGQGFGDFFGVQGSPLGSAIFVDANYVSGSELSGSSIFTDTTFEEIGLAVGSYVWTWSTPNGVDSFTVNVVPEPAHYAIGAGLAALALVALRRRVK